ncbi:MAG: translesion error-prone DNA polymerase V autoproteolytic subunit [Cyanobacteria bacterium J06642_2]
MLSGITTTTVAEIYRPDRSVERAFPLLTCPVQAGFPTQGESYIEGKLDLNRHLSEHPIATFFVRVTGDSMLGAGINPGDLLVVDRALEPSDGKIVIAILDGELTVKRLSLNRDRLHLIPENPDYPALEVSELADFEVWGVVTAVIHKF